MFLSTRRPATKTNPEKYGARTETKMETSEHHRNSRSSRFDASGRASVFVTVNVRPRVVVRQSKDSMKWERRLADLDGGFDRARGGGREGRERPGCGVRTYPSLGTAVLVRKLYLTDLGRTTQREAPSLPSCTRSVVSYGYSDSISDGPYRTFGLSTRKL